VTETGAYIAECQACVPDLRPEFTNPADRQAFMDKHTAIMGPVHGFVAWYGPHGQTQADRIKHAGRPRG